MKTGKNIATNNCIVRRWSKDHYGEKYDKYANSFMGSVTNVKTKEQKFFNNAGEMLVIMEKFYKEDEIQRRKNK